MKWNLTFLFFFFSQIHRVFWVGWDSEGSSSRVLRKCPLQGLHPPPWCCQNLVLTNCNYRKSTNLTTNTNVFCQWTCTSLWGHHSIPAVCCSAWGFWSQICLVRWKYFWWRYIGASSAISQAESKVRSGYTWLRCVKLMWHVEFQAALKSAKVKMSYTGLEMKRMETKKILQKMMSLPV